MNHYHVTDMETGQTITVRARTAENAARRITSKRTHANYIFQDAQRTGGVFMLVTGRHNRYYTRVNVFMIRK